MSITELIQLLTSNNMNSICFVLLVLIGYKVLKKYEEREDKFHEYQEKYLIGIQGNLLFLVERMDKLEKSDEENKVLIKEILKKINKYLDSMQKMKEGDENVDTKSKIKIQK